MNTSKLIIHSNSYTSYIDIHPDQTLADARQIILQEFDIDQLPTADNFAFQVDGVRISHAQEKKNLCGDILNRGERSRVELIPIVIKVTNNVSPPSRGSSMQEQNGGIKADGSVGEREPFACMDSSKSTLSGPRMFKPIGSEANELKSAFDVPIPQRPMQVQHHQEVTRRPTENHGTLPQKRLSDNNNEREERKQAIRVKQEYDSDADMYVEIPAHQSSDQKSDDTDISSENEKLDCGKYPLIKGETVDTIEVKKTVELINLCNDSDEDKDSVYAAAAIDQSLAAKNKEFTQMNAFERKVYLSNKKNLAYFFKKTLPNLHGAECEVCGETGVDKRCKICGRFYHGVCVDESCHEICLCCKISKSNPPQCHLCNQKGGIVVRSYAKPGSMKKWHGKKTKFEESLFGKNNFVHSICGMFNTLTSLETSSNDRDHTIVDCSQLVMADGKSHIFGNIMCQLCGMTNGTKVKCDSCNDMFHVTCARQAGLEVADGEPLKCFNHVRCQYVLRARLEDMMWAEKSRHKNEAFKPNAPIHWNHAATLLNFAIDVLRTVGWAWRWSEWWIRDGDNWEPFECDNNDDTSDEELKIVNSTPQSRAIDAKCCQLEDLGAALRNRSYDLVNKEILERALTALFSTPSLVGPLSTEEIAFFVTWLSLAYQSKSRKLGFGCDKIPVGFASRQTNNPKHKLGKRRLPGM